MIQTEEFQPGFEICLKLQTSPDANGLDAAILEAIDKAFRTIGHAGAEATYRCLQKTYGLNKPDIPQSFNQFVEAIEAIFGKAAFLLEIRIIEELHKQFPSVTFESNDDGFSLISYVESLRCNL